MVCNVVYAGKLFITKSDIIPRGWRHANIFWHRWSSLTQRTPAPAYNAVAVSRDRAGLQRRGRLLRRRRLTTRRATHTSATGLQCDEQLTHPPPRPTRRPRRLPLLRLTRPTAPAYNAAAGSSVCSRGRLGHDWFQLHRDDHQLRGG